VTGAVVSGGVTVVVGDPPLEPPKPADPRSADEGSETTDGEDGVVEVDSTNDVDDGAGDEL
jgi:hypothetical protein